MTINHSRNFIISFLAMRRLIGILGIALPIVVVIGGLAQAHPVILGSISGYYYSNMRDLFVGILSGVAFFLISYRGYQTSDNIVSSLSGVSAVGMILFPTGMYDGNITRVGIFLMEDTISNYIHLAFGTVFFLLLAFNSLFLFTRKHPGVMGKGKKRRNVIYRLCGIIMLIAIIGISIDTLFIQESSVKRLNPVLILETVGLFAFGISWFVKGNTLFKDN